MARIETKPSFVRTYTPHAEVSVRALLLAGAYPLIPADKVPKSVSPGSLYGEFTPVTLMQGVGDAGAAALQLGSAALKAVARAVAEDQAWPADIRIFMLMLWQLEYGNFLAVSQRDISAFLVVSRNTVSRVVRRMLDANIIQSDKYKGASGYRLNPNYVHMGSDAQRAARRPHHTGLQRRQLL
jgi:hypothetical protein